MMRRGGLVLALVVTALLLGSSTSFAARRSSPPPGMFGLGVYGNMPVVEVNFTDTFTGKFGLSFTSADMLVLDGTTIKSRNVTTTTIRHVGDISLVPKHNVVPHLGWLVDIISPSEGDSSFRLGFVYGFKVYINPAFTVTADLIPIQMTSCGDTTNWDLLGGMLGACYYF